MACSKVLLFALNFAIFVGSLAAIGYGIYASIQMSNDEDGYGEMIGGFKLLGIIGWIIVGIAVSVIVLSFAGCCGAWKESSFLLIIYIILLTVVMAFEIAAAGTVFFYGSDMEEQTNDWLYGTLQDYDDNESIKNAWDSFQPSFQCCGVQGFDDWVKSRITVPESCCENLESVITCSATLDYFGQGCLEKVSKKLEENMHIVKYAAIALAVLQLACLIMACWAVGSFRSKAEKRDSHA